MTDDIATSSSLIRTLRTDRLSNRTDNRNRHGTPHIDASTDNQASKTGLHLVPFPLPVANRREAGTGREGRHQPHRTPDKHEQESNQPPAPHSPTDETHGTYKRTAHTSRASGTRTHRSRQDRTRRNENEHEASSRECPETAIPTSETSPETDTMGQIRRPRHERTDPHRPSKPPPRRPPTRLTDRLHTRPA